MVHSANSPAMDYANSPQPKAVNSPADDPAASLPSQRREMPPIAAIGGRSEMIATQVLRF
jgi:hypothetical protein